MDNVKVGNFIKEKRKELKLSQKELAQKLNITDKAISKWETGKGAPDITHLIPLADIFGVSVYDILSGEIIENNPQKVDKIIVNTIMDNDKKHSHIVKEITAVFMVIIIIALSWTVFTYKQLQHYNINQRYLITYDYDKLYLCDYFGKSYDKLERVMLNSYQPANIDNYIYIGNAKHNTKSIVKESYYDDKMYIGYVDENRILIIVDSDFGDYLYYTNSPDDIEEYIG